MPTNNVNPFPISTFVTLNALISQVAMEKKRSQKYIDEC